MKKYKKIILKIIFLIGISLLLYPIIGNIINSYEQKKVLDSYVERVNTISHEENEKIYEEAISYNEEVYIRQKEDKRYDLASKYENVLKIDSTMVMGYIKIPKINIKLPIYHSVEDNVLQKGVGHVKESSLPIGTNNQNSLLMGHTGLPTSRIFTSLEKLEIGDYIQIYILDKELYYKVDKIDIIEPKELIERLPVQENRDLITLVTCTPYGVNSHRLVIEAERTDEIPTEITDNITTKNYIGLIIGIILGIALLLIAIYLVMRKVKFKKNIETPIDNKKEIVKVEKVTEKTTSSKKKKGKKKKKKKKKKNKQVSKKNKKNKKRGSKHAKKH